MKTAAVLMLALMALNAPPTHKAPDGKAAQHAADQQRKAMEAEARRQGEAEKQMIQHQQHMAQEQIKAQQKLFEQQKKAYEQEQKAIQQHQQATAHQPNSAKITGITGVQTTPTYHASRRYYGHYSSGHHSYHGSGARYYRTTPTGQDPQARALLRLKHSLDAVRYGQSPTLGETAAIKRALRGVVAVPRVPTSAAVQKLANNLTEALGHRSQPGTETGALALSLRAALNSTDFAHAELIEVVTEHRAALKASHVKPAEIASVMTALNTVTNQERGIR